MFDKNILKGVLENYKRDLPERWERGEKFKWQAVKCFQDNWDNKCAGFPANVGTLIGENPHFACFDTLPSEGYDR